VAKLMLERWPSAPVYSRALSPIFLCKLARVKQTTSPVPALLAGSVCAAGGLGPAAAIKDLGEHGYRV